MSKNSSDLGNEVPPLEEVAEVLERIKLNSNCKEVNAKSLTHVNSKVTAEKKSNKEFGGLKKGFLFGNPKLKDKSTRVKSTTGKDVSNDLPMIKSQPSKSNLIFKDVQEAMKTDDPFKNSQDIFTSKIVSHPQISKILSDPTWVGILDEFQRDPQTAMVKYNDNKEVRDTMLQLCSMLGDSFLHMAPSVTSEEDVMAQKLMEDPLLKEALTDPFIEAMMGHAKVGRNDKVQEFLQKADQHKKAKIQMLVDYGLFSFIS